MVEFGDFTEASLDRENLLRILRDFVKLPNSQASVAFYGANSPSIVDLSKFPFGTILRLSAGKKDSTNVNAYSWYIIGTPLIKNTEQVPRVHYITTKDNTVSYKKKLQYAEKLAIPLSEMLLIETYVRQSAFSASDVYSRLLFDEQSLQSSTLKESMDEYPFHALEVMKLGKPQKKTHPILLPNLVNLKNLVWNPRGNK